MTSTEEHVAALQALQDQMRTELRDAWDTIHETARAQNENARQITEIAVLLKQRHTSAQCLVYDDHTKLAARLAELERWRDRIAGGGNVLLWVLGGGNLATLGAVIYLIMKFAKAGG